MRWIDTGYLFDNTYFPPIENTKVIYRDWALNSLTVTNGENSEFVANEKFEWQVSTEVVPQIIDIEAEESWLKEHGGTDHFSLAQPRYFGSFSFGKDRRGATATFWDSGLIRTIGFWDYGYPIGTRSCFDKDGYLWCEQCFAWDGAYTGNWTNRYFSWNGTEIYVRHVDVYRFWKLLKRVDGKWIKTIVDEVGLERYADPLVDHLVEYQRESESDPWKSIGRIETSRFLL